MLQHNHSAIHTLDITSKKNSTHPKNGSLHLLGGVGIEKDLHIGGNIFCNQVGKEDIFLNIDEDITINTNLCPMVDKDLSLGSKESKWDNIFTKNLEITDNINFLKNDEEIVTISDSVSLNCPLEIDSDKGYIKLGDGIIKFIDNKFVFSHNLAVIKKD